MVDFAAISLGEEMNYGAFEDALLVAIVNAADANPRGQADVFAVAATVDPNVNRQWVRDAVKSFQSMGYVDRNQVSWGISPESITLMVNGSGRSAAERIKSKAA